MDDFIVSDSDDDVSADDSDNEWTPQRRRRAARPARRQQPQAARQREADEGLRLHELEYTNGTREAAANAPRAADGSQRPRPPTSTARANADGTAADATATEGPASDGCVAALLLSAEREQATVSLSVEQPADLVPSLFPYQSAAVGWMLQRERAESGPLGGILADEQGLGKTVQMLGLCASHAPSRSLWGGVLIVAPLVLLWQWEREITSKVRSATPTYLVCVHHGPKRARNPAVLQRYAFVVTTYDTLRAEHAQSLKEEHASASASTSAAASKAAASASPPCALFAVSWWRVALDEAHKIANTSTAIAKACFGLEARFRWAMTGTPMQNCLGDLFALLKFVRCPRYAVAPPRHFL